MPGQYKTREFLVNAKDIADFNYYDGWSDGSFNMARLSPYDRAEFGEVFGMLATMTSKSHKAHKYRDRPNSRFTPKKYANYSPALTDGVEVTVYEGSQVDYFRKRLDREMTTYKKSNADGRDVVFVKNPALAWYFNHEMDPVGPVAGKSMLRGVATGSVIRAKDNPRLNENVIWMTSNRTVFEGVRPYFYVNRIACLSGDFMDYSPYRKNRSRNVYTVSMLDTQAVRGLLINDDIFSHLGPYVDSLVNYSAEENAHKAVTMNNRFLRVKFYDELKKRGSPGQWEELIENRAYFNRMIREERCSLSEMRSGDCQEADIQKKADLLGRLEQCRDDVVYAMRTMKDNRKPRAKRMGFGSNHAYNKRMTEHAKDEFRTQ